MMYRINLCKKNAGMFSLNILITHIKKSGQKFFQHSLRPFHTTCIQIITKTMANMFLVSDHYDQNLFFENK